MASRAGRKLNRLIAEQVMGWIYWDFKGDWRPPKGQSRATMFTDQGSPRAIALDVYERGSNDVTLYFSPSTDMSDAWSVVQRMQANGHELKLYARPTNVTDSPGSTGAIFYRHAAELLMESEWEKRFVIAQSAPHAICQAALAALGAKLGERDAPPTTSHP